LGKESLRSCNSVGVVDQVLVRENGHASNARASFPNSRSSRPWRSPNSRLSSDIIMQPPNLVRCSPIRSLILTFAAWKALLLLIALCSPGLGYDTSTTLALREDTQLPGPVTYIISKLTRWDAIYFVKAAARGYRYEQEWAFGWGFTRLIAWCTAGEYKIFCL
jgi:Mannosyltransferase (PIG-V)